MAFSMTVVPFLPAMNIFFRVGFVIAERNLYIPSIGFVLLVVHAVDVVCSASPNVGKKVYEKSAAFLFWQIFIWMHLKLLRTNCLELPFL